MANVLKDSKVLYRKLFGAKDEKKKHSYAKRNIKKNKGILDDAKKAVEYSSIILPNESGYIKTEGDEKSYQISQAKLLSKADLGTRKKVIQLDLTHGPYMADYTQNGRYMLLGGGKGQLSLICTQSLKNYFDICVKETIRDVKVLHNHTMLAVAQKKYVHIYDNQGSEVYCLRDRMLTYKLEYLYYHYLMVGIGEFGELSYQDVSTGEVVAKHHTKKGACHVMCQNKNNAVIHLGHNDGTVSLWVPNLAKAPVTMLAHKGPVSSLGVYGNYMVSSGFDGFWKIWDLRKYNEAIRKNYVGSKPPSSITISQTGILSMALGGRVEFYTLFTENAVKEPSLYLRHQFQSQEVKSIAFQPFEDMCTVGTTFGISTLIVPGSGFANFDALEQNPYETGKVSRDREVQRLLEKLPPDSITLATQAIGSYSRDLSIDTPEEERAPEPSKKHKTRGKSSKKSTKAKADKYSKVFKRRQQAISDRIKNIEKEQLPVKEAREKIFNDMTSGKKLKGPVKGAALSRYFAKKH
ncbi:conserved hypothetical protein [Theileria equi strain WA]|uniref:BING4 C-terminal domain-containing protein n=1 Tax=Theileria equi strain WA TaxID=1537102 RepID=L1LD84_THEEQ|nr:conserved hypothetical protein [Theileria equi strain WA]EKX73397.1 conserved hypothetical protein [Theileria equi strain WA]|eukprot:XP_004832849.1 conserved hypothetical protein [Theileria equi strain WA]